MQISFPQKSSFDTLIANKLVCPQIDTVDADLMIKQRGNIQMVLKMGQNRMGQDLLLTSGIDIRDSGERLLLSHDDAGHITGLGRIDGAVTTPATSHYVLSSVGVLTTPVQSGTIDEIKGTWETAVDDILFLFLGPLFGRLAVNASIYIDSIKVYYSTAHNDAYVDFARLYRDSLTGVSTVLIGDNSVDNGLGNVLQATLTVNVGAAVVADQQYYMEIQAEATAGIVKIYGVEVTYHLI